MSRSTEPSTELVREVKQSFKAVVVILTVFKGNRQAA
jgi:hypothetical protein